MQLLHPAFNSLKMTKKKGASTNKKLNQAKEAHEAWLRAQGIHPEQLKVKKSKITISNKPTRYTGDGIKTSDTIVDAGRARGIMANLHNEPAHVKNAILEKASRCTTLYNKGANGLPVASDGTCLGNQSRRL